MDGVYPVNTAKASNVAVELTVIAPPEYTGDKVVGVVPGLPSV